ncbi:hypothetical protein C6341_g27860, partial [Phytophthora cactorum]
FSDPDRVVIVVVPLVALLMDSLRKTEALGVSCSSYECRCQRERCCSTVQVNRSAPNRRKGLPPNTTASRGS